MTNTSIRSIRTLARAREMLMAFPHEMDMYRMHQEVWKFVAAASAVPNPTFLYREEDGIVRVRSADLKSRGTHLVQMQLDRPCKIDLVAVTRSNDIEQPVPQYSLDAWCEEVLNKEGFVVHGLTWCTCVRKGVKLDRTTGQRHKIMLPVARVKAMLGVADSSKAHAAWMLGIGRGRRFGMGMLTH